MLPTLRRITEKETLKSQKRTVRGDYLDYSDFHFFNTVLLEIYICRVLQNSSELALQGFSRYFSPIIRTI